MSKVSVVVPIYNAEKHLTKCIKSILNQSFEDFELILVNDGSHDKSLHICRKFEQKDRRVTVINKNNEGSIATRRRGIELSKSRYVMFVDADDWIDGSLIETLYREAIRNDSDVTVCNIYKVYSNSAVIKKKNQSTYFENDRIYEKENIKNELVVAYLHGHPFPASLFAKLYKKELLLNSGKYLEFITFFGDDLYYNLEIFLKAARVKVIDKPLYFYRTGGNTSKYMSFLFNDLISGYQIQKGVIEEYFQETKKQQQNGISIMLLNTFKTCLYNIFQSGLSENEIRKLISSYISNPNLIESLSNEGSMKYFPDEFLNAIRVKDIDYLYYLGKNIYRKNRPRRLLINLFSRFLIV
jgi:glycosyltransferase involved in cell wall biosynthesis